MTEVTRPSLIASDVDGDSVVDVIVIGAGPVGENVADRVVQGGLTATIVERELVGGECSYWACMPTKALLRDAAALRAARALPAAGRAASGILDPAAVFARRDRFAEHWHDSGQVDWLRSAGITLVRGQGRISGPHTVTVTDTADGTTTHLRARHAVVVATGSSAHMPPIAGLADVTPWTNREAAATQKVPDRLAIIGGGVVGAEMATAFHALGSHVSLISHTRLLPRAELFASEHVTEALRSAGVALHLEADAVEARRKDSGILEIALSDGSTVAADEVLVATGRVANTTDIGLDRIGLEAGRWLTVDHTLAVLDQNGQPIGDETGADPGAAWLFAAGDVNRRAPLTHHGKYQARALGDAIVARANGAEPGLDPWGRHAVTADERALTQVIFTEPEVATVGLTAQEAAAAGRDTRVVDYDLGKVAGAALHADHYRGQARIVIDATRNTVIGFTAVGPDVAELLHAATIAIAGEVPLDRLWHAVPAYPTISEIWLRLLETDGRDHVTASVALVTADSATDAAAA
ncbi:MULTISPECIES: dihydrolipoyl dehydrogenase family protein [Microbacterium]|uniref:NAD(P)/FAD-dependent oxidoreductase n=1 Tax=Microbacterium wangchenii TaxID=2541726 RepID=A0ABX5SQH7_9MICO|nr:MULTISPECIES: NAD(P)/FAD-dependent oxidoreductase [Microbacterium]MCK6068236.1 NAD(P)/FAD-dependent oxidoreductase [Microbacterium sp. EYE_512]QBR87522.1 NAD(P)/FAD-dependent oxidoreductase [Microbacterium wangchenii]TXK15790.1 NAD(P)/FAD-dependent oxidoreductase [Microbacterium wangchenii]